MSANNITKSVSMHIDFHETVMKHLKEIKYDGDFSVWGRKAFRNLIKLEQKESLQKIVDNLSKSEKDQLMDILKKEKEYTF